jgi:hypothetical protein
VTLGVKENDGTDLAGFVMKDTGSTGRGTSASENLDFDYDLGLDGIDFARVDLIKRLIIDNSEFLSDMSHTESDGYEQIRLMGVKRIGNVDLGESVDLDIGLNRKGDVQVYASSEALEARYKNIEQSYGSDVLLDVKSNVIFAKEFLKKAQVYKKGLAGEGGLGGVGVENWILQHGGSFQIASEKFLEASLDENGKRVSFDVFLTKYRILDAGMNLKKNRHDNFVYNMTGDG